MSYSLPGTNKQNQALYIDVPELSFCCQIKFNTIPLLNIESAVSVISGRFGWLQFQKSSNFTFFFGAHAVTAFPPMLIQLQPGIERLTSNVCLYPAAK
jgi:hypothetical protein